MIRATAKGASTTVSTKPTKTAVREQANSPGAVAKKNAASKNGTSVATKTELESALHDLPSVRTAGKLSRKPAFAVPNDFVVDHVASNRQVGSLIAIEFNEFGQIIASRENGPLLRVYDSDNNGTFDTVKECCREVQNVQGIIPLNGELIVSGTGTEGPAVYRLTDTDQDGYYDDAMAIIRFTSRTNAKVETDAKDKLSGEHGAHALTLGPDGYIYALLGNHVAVEGKPSDTSPYRFTYEGDLLPRSEDPGGHASRVKAPGGTVVRFQLNGNNLQTFAGGIRNAYDMVFDANGQLFTHDSDMESDEGTTWYRPTRVLHIVPGAEFGWRSGWGKWPEYFHDSLPPVAATGRGSPTGMVVYNHEAFPSRYRNTIFTGDWSNGRVMVFKTNRKGAGFTSEPVTFMRGKPLNVTDLAVGPDGALYFSTGGRGTNGSIHRVVWTGKAPDKISRAEPIEEAIRQPQPASAFARQEIAILQAEMGADWKSEIIRAARDYSRPASEQVRALQLMKLYGPAPSNELLQSISRSNEATVRAAAAYFMAMKPDGPTQYRLMEMLSDDSSYVRRAACEALERAGHPVSISKLEKLLASSDRHEVWAARKVLERSPVGEWQLAVLSTSDQRVFLQGATALMMVNPTKEIGKQVLARGLEFMEGHIDDPTFVDMLRLFQVTFERAEMTSDDVPRFAAILAEEYPSTSLVINRELMRLLSHLQVNSIMDRYVAELKRFDLPTEDRIHLAIHMANIKSGWARESKFELLNHLSVQEGTGNSVPGYMQNVSLMFIKRLNSEEYLAAIENGRRWPNAAMAAILQFDEKLTSEQINQLIMLDQEILADQSESSKRLKIAILALLARDGSSPSLEYLRKVYDQDESRRVEIAHGLAENISEENFDYIIRSLPLMTKPTTRSLLQRLKGVNIWPTKGEQFRSVIRTAERLGDNGAQDAIALLEHWRGFAPSRGSIKWDKAITAWKRWYKSKYSDLPLEEGEIIVTTVGPRSTKRNLATRQKGLTDDSKRKKTTAIQKTPSKTQLANNTQSPAVEKKNGKWNQFELLDHLMVALPNNAGSSERGRAVYIKAECSKCHRFKDVGDIMGPVLTTISSRFSTHEILDSIVNPSKNVSDQYAAKTIVTSSGKTYHGIIAAAPGDQLSVLLSNGRKVRVRNDEIENMVDSKQSAMPDGLLDDLSLQEVVDLFTFLAPGE